jgi:phosphate starvation-inducible protein PhoH and related proteins
MGVNMPRKPNTKVKASVHHALAPQLSIVPRQPRIAKSPIIHLSFEARTEKQKQLIDTIKKYDFVITTGPAGTGKTHCYVYMAIKELIAGGIDKIYITRPVVEAGENLGFLPGSKEDKLAPYLIPIVDAIKKLVGEDLTTYWIDSGVIEIAPLAFMRGRNLENAWTILDEAQNCSVTQLKMILTRITGHNSKLLIDGDLTQVDLKPGQSGFHSILTKLHVISEIGFIEFTDEDCQRHPVVKKMLKILD